MSTGRRGKAPGFRLAATALRRLATSLCRALVLACLALPGALPAATLAGVQLDDTMRVGGQTLRLASCGVRDTFWIDHYVAGLYLPAGVPPRRAQDPAQPKAVQMKVVEARYLPERIPRKWRHALAGELRREPMLRVRRAYAELADGDVVAFSYRPNQGVTMAVNGRTIVAIEGHGVIDAILDAWAGEDAVAGKLHRLALNNPC